MLQRLLTQKKTLLLMLKASLSFNANNAPKTSISIKNSSNMLRLVFKLELVSKELNHFGVIADLFRQIGGHSSRFVLFCSF